MEEVLNNNKFIEVKLEIIKTIKNIYSQIFDDTCSSGTGKAL